MVSELAIGKRLPTAQYLHKSLLTELPLVLSSFVESISHALKLDDQWNLIKLHRNEFKISYLLRGILFFSKRDIRARILWLGLPLED